MGEPLCGFEYSVCLEETAGDREAVEPVVLLIISEICLCHL